MIKMLIMSFSIFFIVGCGGGGTPEGAVGDTVNVDNNVTDINITEPPVVEPPIVTPPPVDPPIVTPPEPTINPVENVELSNLSDHGVTVTWGGNPNAATWLKVNSTGNIGSKHPVTNGVYVYASLSADFEFTLYIQAEGSDYIYEEIFRTKKTVESPVCEATLTTITTHVERVTEVDRIPTMCYLTNFDSKLKGRIVYEDKTPYKRGAVKAQGDGWVSQGVTNDNGEYVIEVKGDSRFFFSAYSPYGDCIFYPFTTPLAVPAMDESKGYECEYGLDVLTCYENGELRG